MTDIDIIDNKWQIWIKLYINDLPLWSHPSLVLLILGHQEYNNIDEAYLWGVIGISVVCYGF
jgi:hypothetical protein